jgi:hypothetical protein
MTSIEEYRNRVLAAARRRDGSPIYNASIEHARVIIETMFLSADGEMSILSGSLNPQVYGGYDVVSAALGFVRRSGTNMRILLEEREQIVYQDNPFVHLLSVANRVQFRLVSDHDQYKYHFMVSGCDSYRYEQDRGAPEAIAAFGHESGGKVLCEVFDILWDKARDFHPLAIRGC